MLMMRMPRLSAIAVAVVLLGLTGCTPDEDAEVPAPGAGMPAAVATPSDAEQAQAALETFKSCVAGAEAGAPGPPCMEAASTLARLGGPPFEAALRMLDDPGVSPHGKVLIVDAFQRNVHPLAYDLLKKMTVPEKDPMTRVCATALLASVPDVNLVEFLIPLTDDSDPKVSFTALVGVATAAQEGSEFRKRLKDLYSAPDSMPNMREHIAAAISKNPFNEDEPLLITALNDGDLRMEVRRDVAAALGRVGGEAAATALMNAEDVPGAPADYRAAIDLSITVIKERLRVQSGGGGDTIPIEIKDAPTE